VVWPDGHTYPKESESVNRPFPRTSAFQRASRVSSACLAATALVLSLSVRQSPAQEYVPTADLAHPKVKYSDSQVSMNDRCPVRQGKLSTTYKPVYVNGKPIGFC
jgi:hypothetical protein